MLILVVPIVVGGVQVDSAEMTTLMSECSECGECGVKMALKECPLDLGVHPILSLDTRADA